MLVKTDFLEKGVYWLNIDENFQISEDEKLDDLMEQRRMAMRKMKIRNPKSKIIITFHLNL